MSMKDVRTYFRSRLDTLELEEWTDAFNFENIPRSNINNVYHIDTSSFTNVSYSHDSLLMDVPVSIRTFLKGFRQLSSAYDDAIQRAEDIIKACGKVTFAKTQTSIKDVKFSNVTLEQIETNDNIFLINVSFVVNLVLDIDG